MPKKAVKKEAKKTASKKKAPKVAKKETKSTSKVKNSLKNVFGIDKKVIDSKETGEVSKSIDPKIKKQEEKDRFEEYRLNKKVLWGEIIGETGESKLFVRVEFDGQIVDIPDEKFFPKDYKFGERYEQLNEQQKLKKRKISARFRMGSQTPFIITQIVDNPKGIIGDRLSALKDIQERYLGMSDQIKIGDEVTANILAIFENFVLVECLGVETRISAYNLTDTCLVDNCRYYIKPGTSRPIKTGDELTVRIKKLRKQEDGTYYLAVSGRLNHGAKNIRDIHEGDTYIGFVECFNNKTRVYTVKLRNGVNVSVHEKSVMSRGTLNPGDRVSAVIKQKKEAYCCGTCQKI